MDKPTINPHDAQAELQEQALNLGEERDGDTPDKHASTNGAAPPPNGHGDGATYRADLSPDFEEAKRFLTTLDPTAEEFTFQTRDDNVVRRKANKKALGYDPLTRVIHGTLEECWPELVQWNRTGAGIFVCLNRIEPPLVKGEDGQEQVKKRGKGVRLKNNISAIRCNFTDDDDGFAGEYPLPPSVITSKSRGKKQALWLYREPVSAGPARADAQRRVTLSEEALQARAKFDAIQERMVAAYGCDPGAKDLPRVFRLPGFFHRKGDPYPVHVIGEDQARFTQDEVMAAFKAEITKVKPRPVRKNIDNYYLNDYDKWREILTMKSALKCIRVDENIFWHETRKMLQRWRVKHGIPDPIAFGLFDEVSARSEGYCGTEDCWAEWERGLEDESPPIRGLLRPGTLFDRAKKNGWKGFPVTDEDYAEIARHCHVAGFVDGSGRPYSRRDARDLSSALEACADVAKAPDGDAARRRFGKALYDLGWGARGYRLWLEWRHGKAVVNGKVVFNNKGAVNSKDEPLFTLSKCRAEWLGFKDYVLPEGETPFTMTDIVKAANERNWNSPLILNWRHLDRKKPVTTSLPNAQELLRAENVQLRHDEFTDQYEIKFEEAKAFKRLEDTQIGQVLDLAHNAGLLIAGRTLTEFMRIIARKKTYNSVLDYLDGLRWDGKSRAHLLFPYYCNTDDTEYERAVSTLSLVAIVRRATQPGVKYDDVAILEGPQRRRKSSLMQALCPWPDLFTDNVELGVKNKETIELTSGKLIIELPELAGMTKAEVERVKAWLSRQRDEARLSYDRTVTRRFRSWVAFGTANPKKGYLPDVTGNGRYYPIAMKGTYEDLDGSLTEPCKVEELIQDRDQLFAEAIVLEKTYGPLMLPEHVQRFAKAAQDKRRVRTPQETDLHDLIAVIPGGYIPWDELWECMGLGIRTKDIGSKVKRGILHKETIERVMQKNGWIVKDKGPRWVKGRKAGFIKGEEKVEYRFDDDANSFDARPETPPRPAPRDDGIIDVEGIDVSNLPPRGRRDGLH